jgi:hypothetical protein
LAIVWGVGLLNYHEENITITKFDLEDKEPRNTVEFPNGNVVFETYGEDMFKVTITGLFNTWAGVMFAKTMEMADVHIVEFNESDFKLFDGWANNGKPKVDRDVGGYSDLNNVEYNIINGRPVVSYTRLYRTGDVYDKDVEKV